MIPLPHLEKKQGTTRNDKEQRRKMKNYEKLRPCASFQVNSGSTAVDFPCLGPHIILGAKGHTTLRGYSLSFPPRMMKMAKSRGLAPHGYPPIQQASPRSPASVPASAPSLLPIHRHWVAAGESCTTLSPPPMPCLAYSHCHQRRHV